ncbi:hypothetical protein ZWY2020_027856 [Hordeum vulgare]|nr:hypothetical protein ZWY2020_027856 [Hordeum vulgare]
MRGCGETLEVDHGLTEFACPDCGMAQSLLPELMPPRSPRAPAPRARRPYAAPVPPALPAAPARVTCEPLEQVALKPHSKNFAEHGRLLNLAASCSRLAALLPVPASTTLPTISSLSSREKLPLECSSPTTPQNQPRTVIYSQDARCDDMLSGSLSKSSKKRKGRPPSVLVEPRKEADRPVLTPNGTDNWSVDPPFPKKVATTISLLIKQNYPGTYVRATVLDEFLKRYKWAPGHEEECQKIFERKAVKQLVNLFCYEKQRVREELAAKKKKLKGS